MEMAQLVKCLTERARKPDSEHSGKKKSVKFIVLVCNPNLPRAPWLAKSANQWVLGSKRDPVSKKNVKRHPGRYSVLASGPYKPIHMCTYIIHIKTTYIHTKNKLWNDGWMNKLKIDH